MLLHSKYFCHVFSLFCLTESVEANLAPQNLLFFPPPPPRFLSLLDIRYTMREKPDLDVLWIFFQIPIYTCK